VGGGAEDTDAAGGVLDDGDDVKAGAGKGSGFEEVDGEDRVRLAAQERGPRLALSVGNGINASIEAYSQAIL
jgi:hypothetical protein